jgi:predicted dehydrogenase
MPDKIRLGIIGAGGFTRGRMLPNFQKLPDIDVVVVCNRRLESAQQVASQFNIPDTTDDYRQVLERSDVDAVFIGAPPNLHKEAVLGALDTGKHVLCQTRIALTPDEAIEMNAAAQAAARRGVKSMLVRPAPYARYQKYLTHLVDSGYFGELRQVMSYCIMPQFARRDTPREYRQTHAGFGPYNAMQLGLYWDVMSPWVGRAERVLAHGHTFIKGRPESPGGPMVPVEKPDSLTAIAETDRGIVASNVQWWGAHFGTSRVELYGEEATVVYNNQGDVVLGARVGDEGLQPLDVPAEHDDPWHVEADFAALIRGDLEQAPFTFEDGIRNMQYLKAVTESMNEGQWVEVR